MSNATESSIQSSLATIADVGSGRSGYEVHFPTGEVLMLSWKDLHVDLKKAQPALYKQVRYRWVQE